MKPLNNHHLCFESMRNNGVNKATRLTIRRSIGSVYQLE